MDYKKEMERRVTNGDLIVPYSAINVEVEKSYTETVNSVFSILNDADTLK